MDTLALRSLTPARDSITPVCLVGVYRCGGKAIHPLISRASGQPGIRMGREWAHSPGTSTHYMHDEWETPPCILLVSHTHMCTLCSPRIRHSAVKWGHLSPCAAGGLFGRWSQESNGIVFMLEIKIKKNPSFCTVIETRGVGMERDGGWINKSAINHFLFAFVN